MKTLIYTLMPKMYILMKRGLLFLIYFASISLNVVISQGLEKEVETDYFVVKRYSLILKGEDTSGSRQLVMVYYFDKSDSTKILASFAGSLIRYYYYDDTQVDPRFKKLEQYYMDTLKVEFLDGYSKFELLMNGDDGICYDFKNFRMKDGDWVLRQSTQSECFSNGKTTDSIYVMEDDSIISKVYHHFSDPITIEQRQLHLVNLHFRSDLSKRIVIAANGDTAMQAEFSYDDDGLVVQENVQSWSGDESVKKYGWSQDGQLTSIVKSTAMSTTRTLFFYDTVGQLVKEISYLKFKNRDEKINTYLEYEY
jgi:hypothetical protein